MPQTDNTSQMQYTCTSPEVHVNCLNCKPTYSCKLHLARKLQSSYLMRFTNYGHLQNCVISHLPVLADCRSVSNAFAPGPYLPILFEVGIPNLCVDVSWDSGVSNTIFVT